MIIKGKKVVLRAIEPSDLELMRKLINDPELEKTILGWAWPLSQKNQEDWYQRHCSQDSLPRFIIESPEDGVVGFTALKGIDMKNGTCHTGGIRIASEFQRKGYAKDAYWALLNFAFNQLRMHCVQSDAFEDNVASLALFKSLGYERTGIIRECVYKNGKYYNVVIMSILEDEFRAKFG